MSAGDFRGVFPYLVTPIDPTGRELNVLFQTHSLAACVKAGLQIQGFDAGDPIAPQPPLDETARREIAAALARVDAAGTPAGRDDAARI